MKKLVSMFALGAMAVGLSLGSSAAARAEGAASPAKPVIVDVALQGDGVLLGQVVNPQGAPLAGAAVRINDGKQQLGTAKTNQDGYFAFQGLKGGLYQVNAANGSGMFRLWAARTAPPSAQKGALLVSGQDLARGQMLPRLRTWMQNPWVVGGVIATAIAVPVAIAADDDEEEPVSP
ncbi:MAG: carboxypeptidase regulatory-like domain-containing protein [Thermogutta sp.]|nr:carboxypeptidase regulatory-like domain-containing protein [Thermogutta sp.]